MLKFQENVNLSAHSNYKIGGPAKFYFEAKSVEDIKWAVEEAKRRNLKVFILGGGTNILIDDKGYEGLVLKPNLDFVETEPNIRKSDFLGKSDFPNALVRVGAGVEISQLLNYTITHSLSGLEWAGGLPGTFGGAVRGNAGAFGGEIKDTISEVRSFDTKNGQEVVRNNAECRFAYRSSVFKENGGEEIILSATLVLKGGDPQKLARAIQEKIDYRLERHPMEYPNIGSIFKNVPLSQIYAEGTRNYAESLRESAFSLRGSAIPVKVDPFPVVPTAHLISEAGLKGVSFGGAMVSPKHPNFIVNVQSASASDVKSLITLVKKEVGTKFPIELEEEVKILPESIV